MSRVSFGTEMRTHSYGFYERGSYSPRDKKYLGEVAV